ncbi:MAG: hypothetical protein IPK53_07395 [bacterium]|nr:hypothetical protein [bacterium]
MGIHQKEKGQDVISFIAALGSLLGYAVRLEDPMFPGDSTSPQLDVSWRKDEHAKFPLFIFEIESEPTKSASDNALKVFSRKTLAFQKPLFFFHIFVEQSIGKQRIDYLQSSYDSSNYATYLISSDEDCIQLLFDILDQHFRLDSRLNLYELICLLENHQTVNTESDTLLQRLVEIKYDYFEHANFLLTLETLIVNENFSKVRRFYLTYLSNYLSNDYPHQQYSYLTAVGYSFAAHFSILLLLDTKPNYRGVFEQLKNIEKTFRPLPLWEPCFGLSQDHDLMLLSEFPILLTLLCAAFSPTDFAGYFSKKLRNILLKVRPPYNVHGLIWLLLASQVARDEESYAFAQSTINIQGTSLNAECYNAPFVGGKKQSYHLARRLPRSSSKTNHDPFPII